MVFSSLVFLFAYFPIVFLLMKTVPFKFRNLVLLIVSLLFYAWGEPKYILLMLFSCAINYLFGYLIYRYEHKAKMLLVTSIIFNLGLLGFFKYADFIIANINQLGFLNIKQLHLALPIGISFYTFQAMSYPIDIYRKEVLPQKKFVNFSCYVTMFPQLIAGPIVRYKDISDQLEHRVESEQGLYEGVNRFVVGLAKKVLLANNMGLLWESVNNLPTTDMSVLLSWLGIIAFAFQIYFDFSGYSDMAIGLGKMFGFEFLENFNYPYIASSITDFWRRWHISLSTWFRDYLYIPLGGSRNGMAKTIRNLLIVWLVTGLWHGASWNFILWGLYYGLILIFEKVIGLKLLKKLPSVFRHLYAIFLVLIGWVLFAIVDFNGIINYLQMMFGSVSFVNEAFFFYLRNNIFLIIVCMIASTPIILTKFNPFNWNKKLSVLNPVIVLVIMVICVAFICDASYNPFLYFRF